MTIRQDDGTWLKLADLGSGEEFGIMSLHTGKPRSATVRANDDFVEVYEVAKPALKHVFDRHPMTVELIAQKVVEMVMENERKSDEYKASRYEDVDRLPQLIAEIVKRIRAIFGKYRWGFRTTTRADQ